jgi:hypothetical protein
MMRGVNDTEVGIYDNTNFAVQKLNASSSNIAVKFEQGHQDWDRPFDPIGIPARTYWRTPILRPTSFGRTNQTNRR